MNTIAKTSDTELANRVVALGVINQSGNCYSFDEFPCDPYSVMSASMVVRDWRVAGALMEKAIIGDRLMQVERWEDSDEFAVDFGGHACADGKPLPRAIILACVEALE